jgi:hypothetical protein
MVGEGHVNKIVCILVWPEVLFDRKWSHNMAKNDKELQFVHAIIVIERRRKMLMTPSYVS